MEYHCSLVLEGDISSFPNHPTFDLRQDDKRELEKVLLRLITSRHSLMKKT
jgi:hypothetical protein